MASSQVLLLIAVVFSFIALGLAASVPKLPPQFVANYVYNGRHHSDGNITDFIAYDLINQKTYQRSAGYGMGDQDTYYYADKGFVITDEQCRPSQAFMDLFGWIVDAEYQGLEIIRGEELEVWTYQNESYSQPFAVYITTYTINGVQIPLRLNYSVDYIGVFESFVTVDFYKMQVGAPNETLFDEPEICQGTGTVCPNGSITNLTIYQLHPGGEYTMENRNAADLIGDTAYCCQTGTGLDKNETLMSIFVAKVNSSWGQYKLCNYQASVNDYVCVGLGVDTVGREVTDGFAPYGGQCADDSKNGTWYSFDADSQCNSPDQLDLSTPFGNGTGCSWYNYGPVKTISASCLRTIGFYDVCPQGWGIGGDYSAASKKLDTAFAEEDPSKGGCPSINPDTGLLMTE